MGVGVGKSSQTRVYYPNPDPYPYPLKGLVQPLGFLIPALFVELTLGVQAGEFVGHGLDALILGKAFEQGPARIGLGDEVAGGGVG